MSKQKIAIYCRVSTEEQTSGFSLDSQQAILQEYALKKGYDIYDFYIDDGYSGKDFSRPEVQRLFRDIREEKFSAVLAWKVDRISRSNRDVLTLIDLELKPRDMKLLISTCDIDSSTTNGYMFISLLGTFAEYERTVIIERVQLGMTRRATEGHWCGGRILGYDSKEGSLLVNEEEKKTVEKIFELRASGLGYKSISSRLNELGYQTKNKNQFQINSVKTILSNSTYIGKMNWGNHRDWEAKRRKGKSNNPIHVEGQHEAIISQELWNKAQEVGKLQRSKASTSSSYKGEFILSGILRCPQCGAGTVMAKRKKRGEEGHHLYYMCQAYHSKGLTACRTNLIGKEIIEEQVIKVIKGILEKKDVVGQIIQKLNLERNNDTNDLVTQHSIQVSELNKLQKIKDGINQSLLNGKMNPEAYDEAMSAVIKQIGFTESTVHNLQLEIDKKSAKYQLSEEIVVEALNNFDLLFENAQNDEKKQLIRALIKNIEVEPDRKNLKSIIFWFSEDNALPQSDTRRTVS
ncbi:site-specific DNA recombinase [Paenibacillus turicensis]|uniref:Site-specific DNA recombinase n=1 Tax=Paenibacillus turicensis TaxID=160487 RepID=A0ABS4FUW3_9BACL|nr:recombinase family protein [Paenibacillus turicensis]MBP1906325.1 site-specific DNA recombinase [Paenibacillus turicensis]